MNRRGFLGSILAAAAAPAIVRVGSLMPVTRIIVQDWPAAIVTASEVLAAQSGMNMLFRARMELMRNLIDNGVIASSARWEPKNPGDTIVIRRPLPYGVTVAAPLEPRS